MAAALELSNLDGSNGFVINGIDALDSSGRSVSAAGDVNGDGIDDLIIGARGGDPGGDLYAGESYVVFGTTAGFAASLELSALNGANGFVINGVNFDDRSGTSVSAAGDVNGDGVGDLIIGAPFSDPGGDYSAGESYVVFGKTTGFAPSLDLSALNGSDGFVINGIDAFDESGFSVSAAGDVNGDGIDDLIIGAYKSDPGGANYAGESYVVFGTMAGFAASLDLSALNGADGFVINGIDAYDNSGFSVSAAGDVNGDGIDDLIIGAPGGDPDGDYSAGESYVVFGKSMGFAASLDLSALNGADGFVINGIDAFDVSGVSVSAAGDVNGDGIDDLIIGAPNGDPGGDSGAGESYVVFGGPVALVAAGGASRFATIGAALAGAAAGDLIELSFGLHEGPGAQLVMVDNLTFALPDFVDDAALQLADTVSTLTVTGSGDALVTGGAGDDSITGAGGADSLNGGVGNDIVAGGVGNDTLIGNAGDDALKGEDGNDRLFAGLGDDRADGGLGDDFARTSNGRDTLIGGDGDDTLGAGSGGDLLNGGAGADFLLASNGNDRLNSGDGNDTLLGGNGRDTLTGGAGDDRLVGGAQNDRFNFAPGSGADTVVDFAAGAASGDVIGLIGFGAAFDDFADVLAASTQVGANVVIDLGAGESITLQGVTLANLNAGDFAFG